MRAVLKRIVPESMKPVLRRIRNWPGDYLDELTGKRDPLTPPQSLIFIGPGDFKAVGQEFKRHMIELGGLKPGERVLDVGSGIGRMAVPLVDYLAPPGEYHGFDIVKHGISWCRSRISSRYPHFHFTHADIFNQTYNAGGKVQARDFRFPYADGYFDFVLLTSVFTHMLPPDLEHYLSEIARVLKPGGRSLITYFLLNEESLRLVNDGRSSQDFRHELEGCRTANPSVPEGSLAYAQETVERYYAERGMTITSIRHGSWCERPEFLTYQDVVLARKN